ncbi:MAG TPA: cytidylate kinase-like family protein [Lachnospiraceae bacterium]|nr:cytidylate kinase-like family protein [Lachnospiraceae bacterium]
MGTDNVVITISRMYGSGGRTVAGMLSQRLNIPFYDKDLVKLASEDSGINEALFVNADEKVKNSHIFKVAKSVYNGEIIPPESKDFTSNRNLFNFQAKIIKKLAETESCVIVGRCAEFVLKDYDNVLSVLIHAPLDFCYEKASEKLGMSGKELEDYVNRINKQKEEYHKFYTGSVWYDARNYDLCLDSSKLGFDRCVDEIIAYMDVRFGSKELSRN